MTGLPSTLGDAARAYVEAMPNGEIVAFPITALDTIGLPVWIVALFPEDPRLADIMPYGVGYGTSDEQAVLGGLGECLEMIYSALTLPHAERTRASWRDLVASLGASAVADPLTLGLPAGSPVGRDTVLDWVQSRRLRDGATVLVPIDVVALNPQELADGYEPFTTLITNGMGAGPDVDWAVGHGLLELLQRDGNGLLFKALDRGIALDLPDAPAPAIAAIRERFERAGITAIPKYATDEFGLANVYCVGHEADGRAPPLPIMLTACGEACHPDRDRALAKAMCEFAASRVRKAFSHGPRSFAAGVAPRDYAERFMRQAGTGADAQESRAFTTMRDWSTRRPAELAAWLADTVHAVRGHHAFEALPHTPAADTRAARADRPRARRARRHRSACRRFHAAWRACARGQGGRPRPRGRDDELRPHRRAQHAQADGVRPPADPLRHGNRHAEAGAPVPGGHRTVRRPAAVRHRARREDRRPALSALSRT